MRVHELPTMTGSSIPIPNRPMLHCVVCGQNYSAERGDYFMADPNQVMKCHGRNLQLVTRHTEYQAFEGAIAACRKGR